MSKQFLFLLFFLSMLTSCNSWHLFSKNNPNKELKSIVLKSKESQQDFTWFRAKSKINLESKNLNISGNIQLIIRKDSIIWGSYSYMLGIELARFYIDKDSITLIDKINKRFSRYGIKNIMKYYAISEIDFVFIENLILGNYLYKINDSYQLNHENQDIILTNNDNGIEKNLYINNKNKQVYKYILRKIDTNQKISITYFNKLESNGYTIPESIEFKVFSPDEMTFNISYSNVQFNKSFELNTHIPDSYERIP